MRKYRIPLTILFIIVSILSAPAFSESSTPFTLDSFKLVFTENEESEEYIFNQIRDFDVDTQGNFYFLDSGDSIVKVYDRNFRFKFSFGRQGSGPGEFSMLMGIKVIRDKIIVFEKNKIHYFNKEGKTLRTISLKSWCNIHDISYSGEFTATIESYEDALKKLYIYDKKGDATKKLSNSDVKLFIAGKTSRMFAMGFYDFVSVFGYNDSIFWCRNNEYKIYIYKNGKNTLCLKRDIKPGKIPEKNRNRMKEMFRRRGTKIDMPHYLPLIYAMWFDSDMLFVYVRSDNYSGIDVLNRDMSLIKQIPFKLDLEWSFMLKVRNKKIYLFTSIIRGGLRKLFVLDPGL